MCFRSPMVASNARLSEPVGPRSARPGAQLPTKSVHVMTCTLQRTVTRPTLKNKYSTTLAVSLPTGSTDTNVWIEKPAQRADCSPMLWYLESMKSLSAKLQGAGAQKVHACDDEQRIRGARRTALAVSRSPAAAPAAIGARSALPRACFRRGLFFTPFALARLLHCRSLLLNETAYFLVRFY